MNKLQKILGSPLNTARWSSQFLWFVCNQIFNVVVFTAVLQSQRQKNSLATSFPFRKAKLMLVFVDVASSRPSELFP